MSFDYHQAALLAEERRRDAERTARMHALLVQATAGRSRRPARHAVAIVLAWISRASASVARRLDATSVDPIRPPTSRRVGA